MSNENNSDKLESSSQKLDSTKKSTLKSILQEIFIFAIIAVGIVFPFRMFIAEPYLVSGASMDPTFKTGDYLIVDKLSYIRGIMPERNSVIVFKFPNDISKSFIKRIIALPGERVVIRDNTITIFNTEFPLGFKIDQSYVVHTSLTQLDKTLSQDEYFVMGDNRAESYDSRSWGPLNKKYILGKPILRLFPLSKIGILPGDDTGKIAEILTS
ncbi:MAG: signal peptidase I [Minisyncoccia bacterium]